MVAGYRTHIYYDGLPFGEPSESIVYRSNEVDREAIAAAITSANANTHNRFDGSTWHCPDRT